MASRLIALDHVQLAMPVGGEALARAFYGDLLGLTEVPKPTALAGRGGCWFESGEVRVHLGVESPFRPAAKAHPAFVAADFDELCAVLAAAGVALTPAETLAGRRRAHIADPWGNRIELIALRPDAQEAVSGFGPPPR